MPENIAQIIVMRSRFPDASGGSRKLRTGKYCAQAAHASMAFLSDKWRNSSVPKPLTDEERAWIEGSFVKICLYVETEEELMQVYRDAVDAGLTVHLIQDSGRTEFSEPTHTCLAIGPHEKSRIDLVTGRLNLF